jgi:hypothetical protein
MNRMLENDSPILLPLLDSLATSYDAAHETLSTLSSSLTLAQLLSPEVHSRKEERSYKNKPCNITDRVSSHQGRPSLQQVLLSSSPLNYLHGNPLEVTGNLSRMNALVLSSPAVSSPFENKHSDEITSYDTEKEEDDQIDDNLSSSSEYSDSEEMIESEKRELNQKCRNTSEKTIKIKSHSLLQDSREEILFSSNIESQHLMETDDTFSIGITHSFMEQKLKLSDSPVKSYTLSKSQSIDTTCSSTWNLQGSR